LGLPVKGDVLKINEATLNGAPIHTALEKDLGMLVIPSTNKYDLIGKEVILFGTFNPINLRSILQGDRDEDLSSGDIIPKCTVGTAHDGRIFLSGNPDLPGAVFYSSKDKDGNYRITGRIKDMIIRGGENIYPREIEEFLYKMPGIKDVQVAGIPSKRYGEAVGAFIILHDGAEMTDLDVREFCNGQIARYKIPKYIFFVKEYPMTGSGKIQKFKLKDLGLELCAKNEIEII
jgi:acyl-CoA synthetase (AMP-forming)/AMP-acid ligase II